MTPGGVTCKQQKSAGDEESALVLKLKSKITRNPKWDISVPTKWTLVKPFV